MDYKEAKKTYQVILGIEIVISMILGFLLCLALPSSDTMTFFLYWSFAFVLVFLLIFFLSLVFPKFRAAARIMWLGKSDSEIEAIQMLGTNQAFDTSLLSGITYNQTQYTVKITLNLLTQ